MGFIDKIVTKHKQSSNFYENHKLECKWYLEIVFEGQTYNSLRHPSIE